METEMSNDTTGTASITALVAQARSAYQQNKVKECLALVRAVLHTEPDNAAALELQAAVRFDMQRDLNDARALIEESRNKPDAQKFRKAAEIILLKALYLDPDSEGAKTLLASVRNSQDAPPPVLPVVPPPTAPVNTRPPSAPVEPAKVVVEPVPVIAKAEPAPQPVQPTPVAKQPEVSVSDSGIRTAPPSGSMQNPFPSSFTATAKVAPAETSIPFTAGTSYDKPAKKAASGSRLTIPILVVGILVLVGGFFLLRQWKGSPETATTPETSSNSAKVEESSSSHSVTNQATNGSSSSALSTSSASSNAEAPAAAVAASKKTTPTPPDALPPLPTKPANDVAPASAANNKSAAATAPAAMGSLAVSCSIAAEIYQGDKYLGSTPTTLQLPAGNQTLEYRHGDLRAVVTHLVKANETTPALITFDVIVQLNAKPWANVSIEGSTRLPLGQTPLSNVKLPIGSVLVFENPNFPSKSHKIAVDDKTIQMVFQ